MIRPFSKTRLAVILGLGLIAALGLRVSAAPPAQSATAVLASSTQTGKFTFIVFYKQNDAATQSMIKVVQQGLTGLEDQSTLTFAQVTNPAEQELVKRFGLERTPMPMTLAVAPNGAITGIFNSKLTPELLADAFVTPTMTRCMKSMQEGKIVLVCLHKNNKQATIPAGASAFQKDPQFASRTAIVPLYAHDPAEGQFFEQMQIDPATSGDAMVILAPPGVLVGKFASTTTKDEMAAALHKAGQCCDDPNCKHNK